MSTSVGFAWDCIALTDVQLVAPTSIFMTGDLG